MDTQQNLVHYGLTLNPEFAVAYETYQGLLLALRNRNQKLLKQTLNQYEALNKEMDTTVKTLKKHWLPLLKCCEYPYSNGLIEGINGKIKKIKRTSYGFRNMDNFMICIKFECAYINVA